MRTAAEGFYNGVRPEHEAPRLHGVASLLERELERGHSLALERDASKPLTTIANFFAARVGDDAAGTAIDAARRRAELVAGSQRPSTTAVVSFAGEAFDICALDCGWGAGEAAELVRELVVVLAEPAAATGAALFLAASRNPQLLELPPRVALQMQLEILVAFAPVDDASLWVADSTGRIDCVAHVGAPTRTMRRIAKGLLHGGSGVSEGRQLIVGVPVLRWGIPWAAMVARRRIDDREAVDGYLAEAATTISPIVERDMLLERSSARERALVDASEKRLLRLGFDLHDGPLQELAALAEDLRFSSRQIVPLVGPDVRGFAAGRFDDFEARLESLDRNLRELSHSLESSSVMAGPLGSVLEREVNSFRNQTGLVVELKLRGQFEPMTRSQKLALFRIVQEALHNVGEHSNATEVSVEVDGRPDRIEARIADDGIGFDVSHTLFDAARRGRLGLVGMGERARLLGGKLDVRSGEGGPTVIVLMLPRWLPVEAPAAAERAVV
ncbi:MAG: ATP-binding protein [Gaiellaceae bacterium]